MPKILVVDDSEVERQAAALLLKTVPDWTVFAVPGGADALVHLDQCEIDLVLTDLQMPGMDGLSLLEAVKERHHSTPVVIMTSRGSEELAVTALKSGAASYLPKKLLTRDLISTITSVLDAASRHDIQSRLSACLTEQHFSFEIPNDSRLIPQVVACVQETLTRFDLCDERDRIRIGVAVEEALVNAVVHGNLEVGSELRERTDDAYSQQVELRKTQAPYNGRRVTIDIRAMLREATIVIRDEGPGFDVAALPDPTDPDNIGRCSGRGILLMRSFLDEVRFNSIGNEVTMVKRLAPAVTPRSSAGKSARREVAAVGR